VKATHSQRGQHGRVARLERLPLHEGDPRRLRHELTPNALGISMVNDSGQFDGRTLAAPAFLLGLLTPGELIALCSRHASAFCLGVWV